MNTKSAVTTNTADGTPAPPPASTALRDAILCLLTPLTIFVLPNAAPSPYNQILMAVAAAGIFTFLVARSPSALQTKGGSMKPAFALVAFLWSVAAGTVLVAFF